MKKLARGRMRLDLALASADTPVFLLSDRRKILFFNSGCEQLTGWSAEEVLGSVCDFASEPNPANIESVACSLCPPPKVFAGEPTSIEASFVHRNGSVQRRTINFLPLADGGHIVCVLGVLTAAEQAIVPGAKESLHSLHAELCALRQEYRRRFSVDSLICRSEPMLRVLEQIKLVRESPVPVFLEGEDGTGKEHVARVIHGNSEEHDGSFVPLDCRRMRAIDLKLTLRRLLKGARDAAVEPAPYSQFAPRTLYISHVEAMPRDVQELTVDAFQPARKDRGTGLRLLTSSTVDLRQACEDDAIRSDFFYLATAMHIELPPLRRRPDDLELIGQSMLEELNRVAEKQVGGFADEVWTQFRQYNWPGNLDELAAVIREAREACSGETIRASHLPFRFRAGVEAQAVGPVRPAPIAPLESLLTQTEADHIQRALLRSGHNKSKAAKLLGMTCARLYRRMEMLGIADEEIEKDEARRTKD